jgi:hypothetical protein
MDCLSEQSHTFKCKISCVRQGEFGSAGLMGPAWNHMQLLALQCSLKQVDESIYDVHDLNPRAHYI